MAENLTVAPAGSGVPVAADELASFKGNANVLVQYVKLLDGTDNSVIPIVADAAGNLMVNISGYGSAVRCTQYTTLGTVAVALNTMLGGAALANRKNVMIYNMGPSRIFIGDATTQAWPIDSDVPFVQDWGPSVNPYLKSSVVGPQTVVILETA